MKNIWIVFAVLMLNLTVFGAWAQNANVQSNKVLEKPYHPEEDAQAKLDSILIVAKKEKKNIMIQAGGNWCSWCLAFNDFVKNTSDVKNTVDINYVYYHLNYSKENKNEAVFQKYAPKGGELGYPFFIVLNSDGKVLKIQESGSLEEGKSYNKEKVLAFFNLYKHH